MLLIDVYNVTHAMAPYGVDGRDALVDLLGLLERSRYSDVDLTLVCDGEPTRRSPEARAAIVRMLAGQRARRVVYAGPTREADDVIEEFIAQAPDASRLIVVSSDRRLRDAAVRGGAESLKADEFLDELMKDRSKTLRRTATGEPAMGASEVVWWMGYFGMGDAPVNGPARAPRLEKAPRQRDADHAERVGRRSEKTAPSKRMNERSTGLPKLPENWIDEAMRMWPGGIDPGEMDMEAWLRRGPKPQPRDGR